MSGEVLGVRVNASPRLLKAVLYSTVIVDSPNGIGLAVLVAIESGCKLIRTIVIPNTLVSLDTIKTSISQIKFSFKHMDLPLLHEEYFHNADNDVNFENIWQGSSNMLNYYTILALHQEDANHFIHGGAHFIRMGKYKLQDDIVFVEFAQEFFFQSGKIIEVTDQTFSVNILSQLTTSSVILLTKQGDFLGVEYNYQTSASLIANNTLNICKFTLIIEYFINYNRDHGLR